MKHPIAEEDTQMDWRDRITSNPEILVGKPVIKGTRISVELILGWPTDGHSTRSSRPIRTSAVKIFLPRWRSRRR